MLLIGRKFLWITSLALFCRSGLTIACFHSVGKYVVVSNVFTDVFILSKVHDT